MSLELIQYAKDVPNSDLIAAVRDHPTIWDKTHERYKDKGAREIAWKEIIDTVLPDLDKLGDSRARPPIGSLLTKRWNNLRDSYGKYNKAKAKKNVRQYVHANELGFLDVNFSDLEATTEYEEKEEVEDNSNSDDYDDVSNKELPSIRNVSTVDLIRAVKKRPAIWNIAIDGYREKYTRKKAWEKVFKAVIPGYDNMDAYNRRVTGIMVTKKWYNVRDCYSKNFKAKQVKKRTKSYIYEDEINFLDAVFKNTVTNQDDIDEISEEEITNVEENNVFFQVDTEMSEPEPSVSNTSYINPLSTENIVHQDDTAMSLLMNLIEKAEDEDWAFFKSITPSVKSMSEDAKFEFRIEVMNLIKRLKKSDNSRKRMKVEVDCD